MNKKFITFGLMAMFAIVIVTAALVPYLSNTLVGDIEVKSPITITVDGEEDFALELYAGESLPIVSLTEIHVDGVTGHIAEIKISDFDGVGITVDYRVEAYPGIFHLPVCMLGDDAYFYIGDPTETLDKSSFNSTTTFIAALDLEPRAYNIETTVIMAVEAACDSIPSPDFEADVILPIV